MRGERRPRWARPGSSRNPASRAARPRRAPPSPRGAGHADFHVLPGRFSADGTRPPPRILISGTGPSFGRIDVLRGQDGPGPVQDDLLASCVSDHGDRGFVNEMDLDRVRRVLDALDFVDPGRFEEIALELTLLKLQDLQDLGFPEVSLTCLRSPSAPPRSHSGGGSSSSMSWNRTWYWGCRCSQSDRNPGCPGAPDSPGPKRPARRLRPQDDPLHVEMPLRTDELEPTHARPRWDPSITPSIRPSVAGARGVSRYSITRAPPAPSPSSSRTTPSSSETCTRTVSQGHDEAARSPPLSTDRSRCDHELTRSGAGVPTRSRIAARPAAGSGR